MCLMAIIQAMQGYRRTKRFALSGVYAAAIVAGLGWAFGPRGLLAGLIIAILFVAWRHDNDVGVLVPLAVLLIITLLVMFLIFYLLAVIHS